MENDCRSIELAVSSLVIGISHRQYGNMELDSLSRLWWLVIVYSVFVYHAGFYVEQLRSPRPTEFRTIIISSVYTNNN